MHRAGRGGCLPVGRPGLWICGSVHGASVLGIIGPVQRPAPDLLVTGVHDSRQAGKGR
jgi:hypothetical protein